MDQDDVRLCYHYGISLYATRQCMLMMMQYTAHVESTLAALGYLLCDQHGCKMHESITQDDDVKVHMCSRLVA